MSTKFAASLATGLVLALVGSPALAQRPTGASEPRLAVPRTEVPLAQPPGQPTATPTAAQPTEQTAVSPNTSPPAASANAPVTQVSGAPSGVTQLGGGGGAQPVSSTSSAATAMTRSYTASKFALRLGGIDAGFPSAVEGGGPTSDVVTEKLGADHISHKHIAGVKYEDIAVTTTILDKPLMDWIADSWSGTYSRKDGSVIMADYGFKPVGELRFFHALITEVTLPQLDATSKDAAKIIVKLSPEYTQRVASSGPSLRDYKPAGSEKQWLANSFRFDMTGLDVSHVLGIESFTVAQKVVNNAVGELRDYEKEPSQLEIPNLRVTLNAAYAQSWYEWLNDFVVQGNNGSDKERDGSIVYLSSNLQAELGRINLSGCGIFGLRPVKPATGGSSTKHGLAAGENLPQVTADLYCERMQLVVASTKN